MQLGKTPARKDAVLFKLKDYVNLSAFPTVPKTFGHEGLVPAWDMLGNDQYGDCVWAGAAHETMLWTREGGHPAGFSLTSVLSDYSAVTGFEPSDPNTDQGTDMQTAASYRRKTGVLDVSGKRHKIAAYLAITPGDLQEHLVATYLFGAVGIGIQFPDSAMYQFNQGKAWSVVSGSKIEGGHYIPLVAHRSRHLVCVTWGQTQPMTLGFFRKYNDESIAYVSLEALTNGKSLEGFNATQLEADLKQL